MCTGISAASAHHREASVTDRTIQCVNVKPKCQALGEAATITPTAGSGSSLAVYGCTRNAFYSQAALGDDSFRLPGRPFGFTCGRVVRFSNVS